MLDNAIKLQLKEIFANLESNYILDIETNPRHENRAELVDMLNDVADSSSHITCRIHDGENFGFSLLKNNEETGICFRAIPGGHEFTSLIMALLNADGKGKNMPDQFTSDRIRALQGNIALTTYMSLECTNCPDVVQALNIMALLNPAITHVAVDGAINSDEVEHLKIQAVPTVYANGKQLHVGRGSIGELLDKLESEFGTGNHPTSVTRNYDVIIAGGGPAGATAAIYSARKGLNVAIVAQRVGGQVNETVGIENIPSVQWTTGQKLAADLYDHMRNYPIEVLDNRTIEKIEIVDGMKTTLLSSGERCTAPILIAATGASWRRLNIPGEQEYIGRGVAFCPHCDGPFYKNKEVAVIGGGNSGVEAAIDLAAICSKVTLLEFAENMKADTVLQQKLQSLPNVTVFTNTQTTEIVGNGDKVTGIRKKNHIDGTETLYPIDGVFVQIGLTANSGIFSDILETNRIGEIPTDKNGRTAIKGLYAAGDVTDVTYKQIVIAMGEGAKAALAAFEDRMRGEA